LSLPIVERPGKKFSVREARRLGKRGVRLKQIMLKGRSWPREGYRLQKKGSPYRRGRTLSRKEGTLSDLRALILTKDPKDKRKKALSPAVTHELQEEAGGVVLYSGNSAGGES